MSRLCLLMLCALPLIGHAAQFAESPSDAYAQEGRRFMAEGQPDRAALSFEEALRINPFDPVALNNLAAALVESGDYHRALELMKRASRLAPDDLDVAANLSRLRGWLNSYADAGMPTPNDDPALADGRLPPPPPPLWGQLGR